MIKKNSKIILIIIGVIVLSLIAFFLLKSKNSGSDNTSQGTVFGSIKDAISKSLSIKCEYKVGESTTIAYVRGKEMRIDGNWQGQSNSSVIIKEDKIWSWDNLKKEGAIIPINKDEQDQTISEDFIDSLEEQRDFCKVSVYSDSVFTPPEDVSFQDLGDLNNLMVPGISE